MLFSVSRISHPWGPQTRLPHSETTDIKPHGAIKQECVEERLSNMETHLGIESKTGTSELLHLFPFFMFFSKKLPYVPINS